MARRRDQTPWQSFADLAIGLMAVFALTLMLLLWRQNQEYQVAHSEAEQLLEQQTRFAKAILDLMRHTDTIVGNQDAAERWLRARFTENDCLLRLTEDGRLEILSQLDGQSPPDLYDSGKTQLSTDGQRALRSCRDNFLKVAYALTPADGNEVPDSNPICLKARETLAKRLLDPEEQQSIQRLRVGLEALVLAGNTDRVPLKGHIARSRIPPIVVGRERELSLEKVSRSFVENATLGAERARQALGHLLNLVEDCNMGPNDALEVVMSRVRIESSAFGRYQAGPHELRTPGCAGDEDCEAARNLSLTLRWRKEELRKPHEAFRSQFCQMLNDQESVLVRGLLAAQHDLSAIRRQHCDGEVKSSDDL